MDTKAAGERLQNIHWQIENCQSTLLSPSYLQAFNVEARQVGTADDGSPLFEPLYFKPHPEGVFQKHPIDVEKEIYPKKVPLYIVIKGKISRCGSRHYACPCLSGSCRPLPSPFSTSLPHHSYPSVVSFLLQVEGNNNQKNMTGDNRGDNLRH